MKLSSAELQTLHRWQQNHEATDRADCLSVEALTRLGMNEASAQERQQIADHIGTCPACALEYKVVCATKSWAKAEAQTIAFASPVPVKSGPVPLPEKLVENELVAASTESFVENEGVEISPMNPLEATTESPSVENPSDESAPPTLVEDALANESAPASVATAADEAMVTAASQLLTAKEAESAETESETTPRWWQSLLPRFFGHTGFNPFTAAVAALFLITSLSLATWLVALHFKHKAELARLAVTKPPQMVASDELVTPETLQARIDEAQKQLSNVQTQLVEQNADRVLSNQELLGIQNDSLQKEMDDIAKPQLDAPIVDLDASKLPPPIDPTKETFLPIEVPPTAAMFTVILHKPADKVYPSYLIELLDPKKPKPLWSGTKPAAPEPMKINLTLVRRNYPSGKYRIRLSGVDGKKKDVIDTFNLEVKYLPPPKTAKKKR